jgi:hypothetical protein
MVLWGWLARLENANSDSGRIRKMERMETAARGDGGCSPDEVRAVNSTKPDREPFDSPFCVSADFIFGLWCTRMSNTGWADAL